MGPGTALAVAWPEPAKVGGSAPGSLCDKPDRSGWAMERPLTLWDPFEAPAVVPGEPTKRSGPFNEEEARPHIGTTVQHSGSSQNDVTSEGRGGVAHAKGSNAGCAPPLSLAFRPDHRLPTGHPHGNSPLIQRPYVLGPNQHGISQPCTSDRGDRAPPASGGRGQCQVEAGPDQARDKPHTTGRDDEGCSSSSESTPTSVARGYDCDCPECEARSTWPPRCLRECSGSRGVRLMTRRCTKLCTRAKNHRGRCLCKFHRGPKNTSAEGRGPFPEAHR